MVVSSPSPEVCKSQCWDSWVRNALLLRGKVGGWYQDEPAGIPRTAAPFLQGCCGHRVCSWLQSPGQGTGMEGTR